MTPVGEDRFIVSDGGNALEFNRDKGDGKIIGLAYQQGSGKLMALSKKE